VITLLTIFVFGSLVFSAWAWRSYGSLSQRELDGPTDRAAFVIMIAVIVLYSSLFESLTHYTKLSFIECLVVAASASLAFRYLAIQILGRVRRKA